ncbi:MAG: Pertactin autotransporter precursor [Alphaproteobacteria bacterium ADurb.Bin438]|nr:MAG: Pertactin autotransporter precursor [Alphaproteobacteria bacterium ADurb.Bin438]
MSFTGNDGAFRVAPKISGSGVLETSEKKPLTFDNIAGTFKLYIADLRAEIDNIITYGSDGVFNVALDERMKTVGLYKIGDIVNDGSSVSIKKTEEVVGAAKNTSLATVNSINTAIILSRALSNSVHKRLGDLMGDFMGQSSKDLESGFFRAFNENSKTHDNGGKIYSSLQGMEFGRDFKVKESDFSNIYIGVLGQISSADATYKQASGERGEGVIDAYALGGYVLYFDKRGFFIDAVLRQHFIRQSVTDELYGTPMDYKFNQSSTTFTLEIGRQFDLNERKSKFDTVYFITPRFEGGFSYIKGDDYKTSNGYDGYINDTKSLRFDGGALFGAKFYNKEDKISYAPYIKAGIIHEFDGKSESVIDNIRQKSDAMSGTKYEIGGGISIKNQHNLTMFLDASLEKSSKTRNFGAVVGIRYDF